MTIDPARPVPPVPSTLPTLEVQTERLVTLGLHDAVGLSSEGLRAAVRSTTATEALLVVHPDHAPPSALAPRLRLGDRTGFVVADMTDVDDFAPVPGAEPPPSALYLVTGPDRGDHLAGWSPDEALPALAQEGRTPLTLTEGLHWALQVPGVIERNRCYMTIGSRRRRPDGRLDARTPALWISNGTGRDGRGRKDAPKVGWCWAGNRHTWLGFASAVQRVPLPA